MTLNAEEAALSAVAVMGGAAVVVGIQKHQFPPIKQVFGIFAVGLGLMVLGEVNEDFGRNFSFLVIVGSVIYSGDKIFAKINADSTSNAQWPSLTNKPKVQKDSLFFTAGYAPSNTGATATLLGASTNLQTGSVSAPNPSAGIAVKAAYSQIGLPYRVPNPGIPGVGFNCSSLTSWCWAQAGRHLVPLAVTQYEQTQHVPYDQAAPGDLVFYRGAVPKGPEHIGHVGMYIGNGKQIDAPGHASKIGIRNVYSDHFPLVGRVV